MHNQIIIYQAQNNIFCLKFNQSQTLTQVVYDDISQPIGTIYLAKIISVNTQNNTAFIEYQDQKKGFLNYNPKHIAVQVGSKLLVQLEWLGNAEKLPKFNYNIKLMGKYIILHKIGRGFRFSSKLDNKLVAKLATEFALYKQYNITFRTKIQSLNDMELILNEIKNLVNQYDQLINLTNTLNPPKELLNGYYNYNLYLNSLDNLDNIDLITNSQEIYTSLSDSNIQLDLALKIDIDKLVNQSDSQMIKLHQLSGINLFDIDSNNKSLSGYQTNYLVIDEVIRLIMVHDLTGIILIDMIKNMTLDNEQLIYDKFVTQLKNTDWRHCQILGFTKAGIFEIIRSKG